MGLEMGFGWEVEGDGVGAKGRHQAGGVMWSAESVARDCNQSAVLCSLSPPSLSRSLSPSLSLSPLSL